MAATISLILSVYIEKYGSAGHLRKRSRYPVSTVSLFLISWRVRSESRLSVPVCLSEGLLHLSLFRYIPCNGIDPFFTRHERTPFEPPAGPVRMLDPVDKWYSLSPRFICWRRVRVAAQSSGCTTSKSDMDLPFMSRAAEQGFTGRVKP